MGPLYDLLIDEPAEIRHAIGALVYEHLISQKFNSSQSGAKGLTFLSYLWHVVDIMHAFIDKFQCWSLKVLSFITLFPGVDNNSSEVHLGRMLQILREFSADPVLSVYVIDDVWEYMKAMKVCYFQEPRKEMKSSRLCFIVIFHIIK